MANKTANNLQTKLNQLAAVQPHLSETEQWAEISRELARLAHNAQRQELLLETIAAISDAASSILELDELLQVSVNLIRDYFDFYFVGIYLTDAANEWAIFRAGTGELGQFLLTQQHRFNIDTQSLVGRCLANRQPDIAEANQETWPYHSAVLPEIRPEMVLPLINRGHAIGALHIQGMGTAAFSQEDVALFQTLADQLANIIYSVNLVAENSRLLTQAENSQRFLKTVIEHIPDAIFIKDKDHTLLEMNQANARVIGQPQEVLIGKTDQDLFPPELADKFYQRDDQVFATNQTFIAEDTTIWGDGQAHTAYTRLIPIPNAAGQPKYLLGITQDVTESRAREVEREQLLAEMAALYQASRALAGALSERQIFDALFEQIRRHDPCEISAFRFRLVENEPTWADLRANWQKLGQPSYPVGTRFFLPETPQARLLTTRQALFIDDIASDDRLSPLERESFAPTAARSVAILPLATPGQMLGTILIYFTRPYTFTQEVQRLWLAITDQVRVALVNHQLIEEAAYRTIRMETAAEIASAASSILDLQELLNTVVALMRDRFDLYYVGAFLVAPPDPGEEGEGWAVLKAGSGEEGRIQLHKKHRLKIGGESMIGWSIYHRQPRIALDVGKEAVRFQNPDLPKTRSEMALPLIYHGEAIGALTIQSEEQAAFSREDIIFLQTMADQLANAVKNAQLYEQARQEIAERKRAEEALEKAKTELESRVEERTTELRRVNEKLMAEIAERKRAEEALRQNENRLRHHNQTLVELAGTRAKTLNLEDFEIILKEVTEASAHTLEVERASVWLYDEARTKICCIDLYELSEDRHTEGLELAAADYPAYFKALAEERIIVAHNAYTDPRTKQFSEAYLTPFGITSMLDAPIWVGGQMVGVIRHEHTGHRRTWTIEEQNFAASMADLVSLAMEARERKRAEVALHQAYEELERRVKERTAELEESRNFLNSIVQNIPMGIFVKEAQNLSFVQWNKANEELTGLKHSEVIGKTDYDFFPLEEADFFTAKDREVLASGKSIDIPEEPIHTSKNEIRLLHTRKVPIFGRDGQPKYLLGMSEDITERKRAEEALQASEERYRTIFEQSNDMIYITAPGGEFLTVNQAGLNLLGYTREEMLGLNMQEVCLDPADPLKLQQMLEQKGAVKDFEIALRRKDGATLVCLINATLWHDPDGNLLGYQGIIHDMTERKQAEEAQRRMLARTQLLYNISEALATLINQQAAFETVLGEYLFLLNVSRGKIVLLDPADECHRVEALYLGNKVAEPGIVLPAEEGPLVKHLRENALPLVIEDVNTHPLTRHNQHLRGQVEAMLFIPIVTRGEVIGLLSAEAIEKGHIFTPEDVEIGEAIADQLAVWLENRALLAEAQYRSDLLQTAAEISRAASSILDVNQLINTSVNLIRDQFDFYYVGLFLVDSSEAGEGGGWAVLQAGTGEAGRIQLERNHRLKIGGESMIGWCIQNRQARIALDVGQEAIWFQNPVLPDTRSEMALPLISRDQVIGALTVQSTERGAFSAEDITVLQTMADQLANAIENARLFARVTQAQKEAENLLLETLAVQKFSQKLAGTLKGKEILDIFFEACANVIGFEYGLFSQVDTYQNRVKAIAGFGVTESHLKRANHSLDSNDITADIVKTGKTEVITGWDERFDREIYEAEGHANWVRVFTPVTIRQENIGLIEVGFKTKNTQSTITEAQIRLLRTLIDQTALALDNAQRYEASQRAARREALIKEITTKVRASTNLDTILQTTVKEIGEALDSQRTYVHLISLTNKEGKA